MKAKTPRVPRSSRSNSVSWPECPSFLNSSLISRHPFSSPMRRLQKSQGLRRVHRQQGTRPQVVEEVSHPQAAPPGNDRKKHPANVERRMERRLNMPKDIDNPHK